MADGVVTKMITVVALFYLGLRLARRKTAVGEFPACTLCLRRMSRRCGRRMCSL